MAITKANIRSWDPTTLTIGGVDYGALGEDSVSFNVEPTIEEIRPANSTSVVKRIVTGWSAWLEFAALEVNLAKLTAILGGSAAIGTLRELPELACVLTITLSDATVYTITGNVTFDAKLKLGLSANKTAQPPVRADFMPDTESAGLLATLAAA